MSLTINDVPKNGHLRWFLRHPLESGSFVAWPFEPRGIRNYEVSHSFCFCWATYLLENLPTTEKGFFTLNFLLWYITMAVFLLNLFLNFSPKKPKSLIVVVLTAQFSPNRVILIGGAQSCNTAQCGEWRSLVSKSKL